MSSPHPQPPTNPNTHPLYPTQYPANPTASFLAVLLIFVQCVRRFYETHFVQIFSASSRINLTHYVVGYYHYFGALLAVLSQARGFVRESPAGALWRTAAPGLQWGDCSTAHWLAVAGFVYAWYHQFESNRILARLRCNADGAVVTHRHRLPSGGYFELVSSPHMLFEVVLYVALFVLLHNNSSWLFVLCWVLTNQIENAWLTHKWYRHTFADYPAQRRAIFPAIL